MYGVGTDMLAVTDGMGTPTGVRHAVARDGLMLCRPVRPRYTWAALSWDADAESSDACATCIEVATAALEPAYPEEPAFVPAQAEAEPEMSTLEHLEW